MVRQLLLSLGISLGLTIVLELLFAITLGKRQKDLLLVCLVNVITNPVVVLVYYLAAHFSHWNPLILKAVLEILAVLTEACLYKRYGKNLRHPFLFALSANVFSFGIGELISFFGG